MVRRVQRRAVCVHRAGVTRRRGHRVRGHRVGGGG